MAANVYVKELDSTYFTVQSGNLVQLNLIAFPTRFFVPNPTTIFNLGGTKLSSFTEGQVRTNFQIDATPTALTILAETEFQSINWINKGWTANVKATFLQEIKAWIYNNLDNAPLNPFPATAGFVINYVQGQVQPTGFSYSIPIIAYGNIGTLI